MMVANADGEIRAEHVHEPLIFAVYGSVFYAEPEDRDPWDDLSIGFRVWRFDPVRGFWVSEGMRNYHRSHRFKAVAERTRAMFLDGRPLPSAPDGNPDSPRKWIKPGMDVTVNGRALKHVTNSVKHNLRGRNGQDATTFFAYDSSGRLDYITVYDTDRITLG